MDQSDPGLPQPWPAHCSQGPQGRHLRGWTLGVGPTLAALGRAPTVSHGQGAPPQTMIRAVWVCYLACRLLACSPPLPPPRNPRTWNPRAALSYRPWAEEETRRVGEGDRRGVCLPRGSMFGGADATGWCRKPKSMMCCLEETDGNREDMDGQHDGVSIQAVSELCVVVPEWKPSDCPIGSRGAAQGSAAKRLAVARCDADDCRPRVGTCSAARSQVAGSPGTHHPCSHVTRGSGLTPRRDGTCQPPGSANCLPSCASLDAFPSGSNPSFAVAQWLPQGVGILVETLINSWGHVGLSSRHDSRWPRAMITS